MSANFNLTPLPRHADGARVKFDCDECGHTEIFTRLKYVDIAHVLGADHYRGDCPAMRAQGEEHPQIAAHRLELRRRHCQPA